MADPTRPGWVDYWKTSWKDLPPVSPGTRASKYLRGIALRADWEHPFSGFNKHARALLRAFHLANLPTKLLSHNIGGQLTCPKGASEEWLAVQEETHFWRMIEIAQQVFQVIHVIPTARNFFRHLPDSHPLYGPDELANINKGKIISTVLEADRLPSEGAARQLRRAAQVWVASKAAQRVMKDAGIESHRVPIPFQANSPLLSQRVRPRDPGPPRFYHIGKWEARKAQDKALLAFLLAFKPGEAKFFLKTSGGKINWESYPKTPSHALKHFLKQSVVRSRGWDKKNVKRDVFVIFEPLPESRITAMHGVCDVYVTVSRGEGYDMPAFDAKLAGNRMIFTPSGGPQDFAGDGDFLVQASGKVRADSFYQWGEARYLDYRVGHVVEAFKQAARAVEKDEERWKWASTEVPAGLEHALEDNVASQIRGLLEQAHPIVKELHLEEEDRGL